MGIGMPSGGGAWNFNPVKISSRMAASVAGSPDDPLKVARVTRP
jgi:hypothetical protein